jgi:hypothetical protein
MLKRLDPAAQVTVGTTQDPATELKIVPYSTYPAQLPDPSRKMNEADWLVADPALFVNTARNSSPVTNKVAYRS